MLAVVFAALLVGPLVCAEGPEAPSADELLAAARNQQQFIEALAARHGGFAVGTYMSDVAAGLPAPNYDADQSAFEILAGILNGQCVGFGLTPSWCRLELDENDEPKYGLPEHRPNQTFWYLPTTDREKEYYAGCDEALLRIRQDGSAYLLPRRDLDILACSDGMRVIEGTDDLGRPLVDSSWHGFGTHGHGGPSMRLKAAHPSAKRIRYARVQFDVALCRRRASIVLRGLAHTESITIRKEGAVVTIAPLRKMIREGKPDLWIVEFDVVCPFECPPGKNAWIPYVHPHATNRWGQFDRVDGTFGRNPDTTHTRYELGMVADPHDPSTAVFFVGVPVQVDFKTLEMELRDIPLVSPSSGN